MDCPTIARTLLCATHVVLLKSVKSKNSGSEILIPPTLAKDLLGRADMGLIPFEGAVFVCALRKNKTEAPEKKREKKTRHPHAELAIRSL